MATPGSAFASCDSFHANVQAYDNSGSGYFGNFAHIYVNTSDTINGLNKAIGRTLLVFDNAQTGNVEFGWTANNGGYAKAVAASDYMVNGFTQPPNLFGSTYPLNMDTHYSFRIENANDIKIFRYYFDGQSSPIGYSPTMSFNEGYAVTNDERNTNCDTLYTDMTGLQDMISNGSWYDYNNFACWTNTSSGWYLHSAAGSTIDVNTTADQWGAPGC